MKEKSNVARLFKPLNNGNIIVDGKEYQLVGKNKSKEFTEEIVYELESFNEQLMNFVCELYSPTIELFDDFFCEIYMIVQINNFKIGLFIDDYDILIPSINNKKLDKKNKALQKIKETMTLNNTIELDVLWDYAYCSEDIKGYISEANKVLKNIKNFCKKNKIDPNSEEFKGFFDIELN